MLCYVRTTSVGVTCECWKAVLVNAILLTSRTTSAGMTTVSLTIFQNGTCWVIAAPARTTHLTSASRIRRPANDDLCTCAPPRLCCPAFFSRRRLFWTAVNLWGTISNSCRFLLHCFIHIFWYSLTFERCVNRCGNNLSKLVCSSTLARNWTDAHFFDTRGIGPWPGGLTNYCPSVLWHCWLGHLTRKIVPNMTYNVFGGNLNPTLLLLWHIYHCSRVHRLCHHCATTVWNMPPGMGCTSKVPNWQF